MQTNSVQPNKIHQIGKLSVEREREREREIQRERERERKQKRTDRNKMKNLETFSSFLHSKLQCMWMCLFSFAYNFFKKFKMRIAIKAHRMSQHCNVQWCQILEQVLFSSIANKSSSFVDSSVKYSELAVRKLYIWIRYAKMFIEIFLPPYLSFFSFFCIYEVKICNEWTMLVFQWPSKGNKINC